MQLYDVVALLIDLPEENLKRGQVGTIIEEWEKDVFEVEFSNTDGISYAQVAIHAQNLMNLYWQPEPNKRSA